MSHQTMTLQDILLDIHALTEDIEAYERKYGILSETFYDSYLKGEEPEEDAWVLDWADWAGAYKLLLRRREQYRRTQYKLHAPQLTSANPRNRSANGLDTGVF